MEGMGIVTLPETNSKKAPENRPSHAPKGNERVFQPSRTSGGSCYIVSGTTLEQTQKHIQRRNTIWDFTFFFSSPNNQNKPGHQSLQRIYKWIPHTAMVTLIPTTQHTKQTQHHDFRNKHHLRATWWTCPHCQHLAWTCNYKLQQQDQLAAHQTSWHFQPMERCTSRKKKIAPRKINMEQNHGGLEDNFPF